MATKPELRRAVVNGYIKAGNYNYNFDQLNNYIENGIADNAINNYEDDREYSKEQWVLANTSEGKGLYESQVDGNKGNSLLDTTYWKKVIIDGDLSRIGEQLADKVNMLQASGAGMPSSKYIDLTVGADNTEYTAPANGWYSVKGMSDIGQYGMVGLETKDMTSYNWSSNSNGVAVFLPVKKGDVVKCRIISVTQVQFRFVYAEGSKEE